MKQLSEEKRLRLDKLELLTYDIEVGNTHRVRKVKGTNLNAAFLLGELSDNRRTMLVRQAENDRTPVRVENKSFETVLRNILVAYVQSKRCGLPFNEAFACKRLSLKSWPQTNENNLILIYGTNKFALWRGLRRLLSSHFRVLLAR